MWHVSEREESKMTLKFLCLSNWKDKIVIIQDEGFKEGTDCRRPAVSFETLHLTYLLHIRVDWWSRQLNM